jgi:putative DNA primase/helicase
MTMPGRSSDLTLLRAALMGRAAELAVALLGEPNRAMSSKRELRFGRHGSLAVAIAGPKAGLWHDHEAGTGGDMLSLIARERGGDFRDAVEFAEQFIGQAPRNLAPVTRPQRTAGEDDATEDRRRHAMELWHEAAPITGTVAALYLANRRISDLDPGIDGEVLRFHPSCPYDHGVRQPCMIALLRDIHSNQPRAIQRTALTPVGGKIGRRTLGPKSGCAIKSNADADVADHLTVGEGCETVLAGMVLGYRPAWALGDAGELAAFPVLAGVESITILVDHDESGTGQAAALTCSARWTGAGREVFRLMPRQVGADANDLLLGRRRIAG